MMNRRTFLQSTALFPAAVHALTEPKLSRIQSPHRIGVQLYTVRDLLASDYEGTIRVVAEAGYDEVETVWDGDRDPDDIRALFEEVGLDAPSTHVPLETLRDNLTGTLDVAGKIGYSYIVCAWLEEDQRSMSDYRSHVVLFNEVGEACKEVGIQFAYHNHQFEFEATEEGIIPYDYMLAELDPDLVKMEIDLYWIAYANQDAKDYFQRHPGRFPLCHLKDMGEDLSMTPVGEGQIDFTDILSEHETAGLKHYFVEHDNPKDPLASIRSSINYIKSLKF